MSGVVTKASASCAHRKNGACGECFWRTASEVGTFHLRARTAERAASEALDWLLGLPFSRRPDGAEVLIERLNAAIRGTEQDQSKEAGR